MQIILQILIVGTHRISEECASTGDNQYTQVVKDVTHHTQHRKPSRVPKDKQEGVLSRCAEVLTRNGDLNIGILIKELDEALEAH